MQAILAVTVPFFALVLCGWLAAWRGVLPEMAIPGLNAYVLFFALPCMLFRFGASMPFAQLIDPVLIGVYAASALLIVFVTIAATLARHGSAHGVELKDAAFGALVAAFPNTGFMGVPLLVHCPAAARRGRRRAGQRHELGAALAARGDDQSAAVVDRARCAGRGAEAATARAARADREDAG
jgi:predicted permease